MKKGEHPGIYEKKWMSAGKARTHWYFWVMYLGSQVHRKALRNTIDSAVRCRDETLKRIEKGLPPDADVPLSITEILDEKLLALESEDRRAIPEYRRYRRNLVVFFRTDRVDQLPPSRVRAYREERRRPNERGQQISQSTINREISFLLSALNQAAKENTISHNPLAGLRRDLLVTEASNETGTRFYDEELKAITNLLEAQYQPVPWFALYTGMREGEICKLRWWQVSEDGASWVVTLTGAITKRGGGTKAQKTRTVPLAQPAIDLLPSRAGNHDFVFPRLEENWETFQDHLTHAFARAADKAGLGGITFHSTRHEWASRFYERTHDLKVLQKVGGWSTLKLVERYAQVDPERETGLMAQAAQPRNRTLLIDVGCPQANHQPSRPDIAPVLQFPSGKEDQIEAEVAETTDTK